MYILLLTICQPAAFGRWSVRGQVFFTWEELPPFHRRQDSLCWWLAFCSIFCWDQHLDFQMMFFSWRFQFLQHRNSCRRLQVVLLVMTAGRESQTDTFFVVPHGPWSSFPFVIPDSEAAFFHFCFWRMGFAAVAPKHVVYTEGSVYVCIFVGGSLFSHWSPIKRAPQQLGWSQSWVVSSWGLVGFSCWKQKSGVQSWEHKSFQRILMTQSHWERWRWLFFFGSSKTTHSCSNHWIYPPPHPGFQPPPGFLHFLKLHLPHDCILGGL